MKKRNCMLLAGVLSLALIGCGSTADTKTETAAEAGKTTEVEKTTEAASSEVITLKVWGGVPAESGPQESIDLFNEAFKDKGIQAEYVYYVNDDNGNLKLETNLLAGEGVDLYMCYDERQISKRIEGNMALDLTELSARDGFDIKELFGQLAEQYEFDGKFYCIPTKLDQHGMMVNKDMFDEAGIEIPESWTYSEFREIAKKLTHGEGEDKVYGAFLNTQQNMMTPFQYFAVGSLGGSWMYSQDGTATNFTDPIVRETVQLTYDMMNVDGSAPTHVDCVTQKLSVEGMFWTEKTAMVPASWTVRNVKNQDSYPHDFVTAFAPYPTPDSGEASYVMGGAGDLLCINPKSPNIEACWEYAKWYATEGILPLAYGGRIPLCKTIDMDEVSEYFFRDAEGLLDEGSTRFIMMEPKDNYAVTTYTYKSSELTDIMTEEMEAILNGQKTIDEGLQDAVERGDTMLAK